MRMKDRPGVIAPPPLIFVAAFAAGWLLRDSVPRFQHIIAGAVIVIVAAILMLWGLIEMMRARTPVDPYSTPTTVVTTGPFRFTRNPLYLAMNLFYAGTALWTGWMSSLILLPVANAALHFASYGGRSAISRRNSARVIVFTAQKCGDGCEEVTRAAVASSNPQNHMRTASMRIFFSALAAAALAACFARGVPDRKSEMRVRRGPFNNSVVLTGELRAARGDDVTVPRLPSWQTSIKWLATDGAEVHEGDRVVELDNSQFATNLEGKRQAVAQAQQELQQREAEWASDTLEKQLEVERKRSDADKARIDASVPRDLLSVREYEDRQLKKQRTETELAKANDVLRAQRAGVAADRENLRINLGKAQRELATAEQAIAALILRAPRDGIVVLRDHPWEGRKLQEGDVIWVGFAIAQIPDMPSLRVEASLADVDDGKVARGMMATVVLDAYPANSFRARVTEISAVAQESSRNSLRRQFRVVVGLDQLDLARMRPGLSARVIIDRSAPRDTLLVPRAAVDFSTAKPRARLASGKIVDVTLGECNAHECVVVNGLKEGDTVRPNA